MSPSLRNFSRFQDQNRVSTNRIDELVGNINKGLLPLLPVTPDVDRPSTFPARFLDRAGRCAGAFGLGEVGFESCQAGWRAGTRP